MYSIKYQYKTNKYYKISHWRKIKEKNDYEKYDKKGNIIECGVYGEVTGGNNEGGVVDNWDNSKLFFVEFSTYDNFNKRISDQTYYYRNNKKYRLSSFTYYSYDLLNRLVKEQEFNYDSTIIDTKRYYYDIAGNLVSMLDSMLDVTNKIVVYSKVYEYNTQNRIISMRSYKEQSLIYREKYTYNNESNTATTYKYDNDLDTSLWSITKTTYESGRIKEKFWTVVNGKTEKRLIYKYNDNELLENIFEYSGLDLVSYTRYRYKFKK